MTFEDTLAIISTISVVVAAAYAILGYHRPPGAATQTNRDPDRTKRFLLRWLPPAVALLAVGFGYYDRHFSSKVAEMVEQPLNQNDARLEVGRLQPVFSNGHLYINIYMSNKGNLPADSLLHDGIILQTKNLLQQVDIAPLILYINAKLSYQNCLI